MSVDQEMFDQVARGNLSAEEKRQLLEKATTQGQQGVLPGLGEGPGGLFGQEPQAPKTPSPPKSNMDILVGLPTGAWQEFTKSFTDEEVALLEKAIDAGLVKLKKQDDKVLYSRTGDLGTWLADQSSVVNVPPKEPAPKPQKPANLGEAFTDLINRAFEHPNPPGPITPKDIANIVVRDLGIPKEELDQRRKEIEETFEFALVRKARKIIEANQGKDPLITFSFLKKLYSLQPTLTSRTSSSIRNQAYSTPAPLAYLMSQWTGITPESWVYEPTGGNGMLLIGANPEQTWANEIDKARAGNLREQGFDVTQHDARKLVGTANGPQEKSVDAVVANPPFGNLEQPAKFDGYKIEKMEHLIALDALKAMDDEGRAAIILGGHSFFTPWGQPTPRLIEADRVFFNYLYSRYNVTHHINIDGKVYERMGTKFPIRLITIEGRKAQPDKAAAPHKLDQIEVAKNLDDVYTLFKGDFDALTKGVVAPRVPSEQPASPGGPGGVSPAPGSQGGTEPGNLPGGVAGEGPEAAGPTGAGGGIRNTPGPGPAGGGRTPEGRPGGRPVGGTTVTPGQRGPQGSPGVSPQPKPGTQEGPAAPLPPEPQAGPPQPAGGTGGTEGSAPGRVPPKSIGSGTKVTLPDGTIVTIKSFSAAPKPTQGGITLQDVQKEFGQVKVEQAGDGFALTLPNGNVITILTNQQFPKSSFEELKKDYPKLTREQYEKGATLGEWRAMSVGGAIALAKGSGRITLRHELFHAACDLVLTGKELGAILAKYGNWEAAAKAYEVWKPKQPHGLFAKIYHFFRRLAALLKPNAVENIFRRIDSGQVWMRTGAAPGTLTGKAALQFGETPEQMVEVEDENGNVRRIPISQIQGVIDQSGKEIKLTDQDRQELRVFQKGQQVETNSGVTGEVTKVRGWGEKMVLTVQGPEGAINVKPADVKNIVSEPVPTAPTEAPEAPVAKGEKVAIPEALSITKRGNAVGFTKEGDTVTVSYSIPIKAWKVNIGQRLRQR